MARRLYIYIVTVVLALAAAAIVIQSGYFSESGGTPDWAQGGEPVKRSGVTGGASWVRSGSVGAMVAVSDAGVAATVESVKEGEPLVGKEEDGPPKYYQADLEPMPTQLITFVVRERWFGSIGDRFELSKTGTDSDWMQDDPPYKRGQSYALFMQYIPEPEYRFFVLNSIDGRLEFQDGVARSVVPDGPVREALDGKSLAELRQSVKEALKEAEAVKEAVEEGEAVKGVKEAEAVKIKRAIREQEQVNPP